MGKPNPELCERRSNKSIWARGQDAITRNAAANQAAINKQRDKEAKEQEKVQQKAHKEQEQNINLEVNERIKDLKSDAKDQKSLMAIINSLNEETEVNLKTKTFLSILASQIDKMSETRLITKNSLIARSLQDNSFVNKFNHAPKVSMAIAKIIRLLNPSLNPIVQELNPVEQHRKRNDKLFNAIKDLIFEIVKVDMLQIRGVE